MDHRFRPPAFSSASSPAASASARALTRKEVLFQFEGRISRVTFWQYSISVAVVATFLLFVVTASIGMVMEGRSSDETMGLVVIGAWSLLAMPLVWITLALHAKRLHDSGRSSKLLLAALVPVIGGLWLFLACGFFEGTPGANSYGEVPG